MMKLNSDKDRFSGGLFLTNNRRGPKAPLSPDGQLFLTQEGQPDIRKELTNLITRAEQVLKVCSYILTDPEIFSLLLNKARERKLAIFLLTQLDASKLRNSNIELDLNESDPDGQTALHLNYIKRLYDQGVHVRAATTAHAKFVIVDRSTGFLTSANLTTPSLEKNMESGIYLNATDTTALDNLFDLIFQKGTQYRQYITASRNRHLIVQTDADLQAKDLQMINACSGLCFTYEEISRTLYDKIVATINEAQEYIYLATFSIVELQNLPEFCDAIKKALARGVKCQIFCRGMNFRNDHLTGCEWLRAAGCEIYGDYYNHSKGIANERSGMIFTANIDGRHGLMTGFEVGCLLDPQQRAAFVSLHEHLVHTGQYVFQDNALRRDFFNTYLCYEAERLITRPELPSAIVIDRKKENIPALSAGPIFFGRFGDNYLLTIGNEQYISSYNDGVFEIISKERKRHSGQQYLLKYETLTIH